MPSGIPRFLSIATPESVYHESFSPCFGGVSRSGASVPYPSLLRIAEAVPSVVPNCSAMFPNSPVPWRDNVLAFDLILVLAGPCCELMFAPSAIAYPNLGKTAEAVPGVVPYFCISRRSR